MSISGFRATNHPQQTAARGATDEVDDRGTTPELFDPLHERFRFTLDVAAAPHNAKCDRYYTREDDGLSQSWTGERVWCNPPYSNIGEWVRAAWAQWEPYDCAGCGGAGKLPATTEMARLMQLRYITCRSCSGKGFLAGSDLIVMLLPANRTEQGWWQDLVEPALRARRRDFHVEFLRGRPRFIRPNAVIGPKGDRPPFGCCLLIWQRP